MPEQNDQLQATYSKNLPQSGGSAFAPPSQQGSTGIPQAGGNKKTNKKESKKIFGVDSRAVMAALGLGLFLVVAMAGVLISQKQRLSEDVTAPSAPKSQPAANIEKPKTCSMTFTVPEITTSVTPTPTIDISVTPSPTPTIDISITPSPTPTVTPTATPTPAPGECSYQGCEVDADCDSDLICVTADDGNNYCAMTDYEDACIADATEDDAAMCCEAPKTEVSPTPTPTASPTPAPGECGSEGCEYDSDCEGNLICVTGSDGNNFCSMSEYEDRCAANSEMGYSSEYCCTAPTATPKPGNTATPEPGVTTTTTKTTVITTVSCNDACTTNSDCTNISHICYNGACRLDSNPESTNCTTPSGGTTVIVEQPVIPQELPQTGFEDLAKYLKVGLGALGAGVLLLLFL